MGPDRAVGELDLLDPLMAVVDRIIESDAVGAAGDTQDEVAAAIGLGDGDVGGQDSRAKLEHVGTAVTAAAVAPFGYRSEEHTSELQSLMRISYAVFCLKKKKYES